MTMNSRITLKNLSLLLFFSLKVVSGIFTFCGWNANEGLKILSKSGIQIQSLNNFEQASILNVASLNTLWLVVAGSILLLLASYLYFRSRIERIKAKTEEEIATRSTQLKEQFLANMSHEFRTPLNAIVGMTRLMRDNNPKADQINYLDAITRSSENLMSIITDILDISKIEAGRIQLEKIPFDVRIILRGVYDTLHLQAREKNLEYEVTCAEDVPTLVMGDPLRLSQMLGNLVGNAIKFTETGEVLLNCSAKQKLNGSSKTYLFKFTVTDTGIGIPATMHQTIFNSFSQADSDATRKFGGAGLGLSVTKKLVELHGGKINLQSSEGKGATFTIEIPLDLYEGEALVKNESITSRTLQDALKGLSVLLVEDIEFNRIVALDTLKTEIEGVKTDVARNGQEAVEMCSKQMYDVILMDLQMPVLNGYDATREIRKLQKPYSEIPVIAMTASALQDEIARCYECGMNDFITKPFNTELLFKKILNQIRLKEEVN